MKTVKRAYLYLVSLVSIQMVGWGAVLLLRQLTNQGRKYSFDEWGGLDNTAIFVALILVGLPLFLIHWWSIGLSTDTSERNAGLRKFYLYANLIIWMGTLVVVGMDLLNATLRIITRLKFDGYKPWANLFTLIIAGLLWILHTWWNRSDEQAAPPAGRGQDLHRFYQYLFAAIALFLLYNGLSNFIAGVLQLLADSGDDWQDVIVPTISSMAFGAALVLGYWWPIQRRVQAGDEAEKRSGLRAMVLHFLVLIFALGALNSVAAFFSDLIKQALDVADPFRSFWIRMSVPIGQIIGGGLLWAYQTWIIFRDPEFSQGDGWRRAGKRLYAYLLATVGLTMFLMGLIQVITEVLNRIDGTTRGISGSEWMGRWIVSPFVGMGVGFVVWGLVIALRYWLPRAAHAEAEERRSLWRRIYVSLFTFIGVALAAYASLSFIRLIVNLIFGVDAPDRFLAGISNEVTLLLVGGTTWVAFRSLLWADERKWPADLAARPFHVIVIDGEETVLGQAIIKYLKQELPGATIESLPAATRATSTLSQANVIIGSWEIANRATFAELPTEKVLVPFNEGWSWAGVESVDMDGLAKHAAQAARQVADGEPIHPEGRLPTYAVAAATWSVWSLPFIFLILTALGTFIAPIFFDITSRLSP